MIKFNIFDMFSSKGRIIHEDEYCIIRETRKLNNINVHSVTLYKNKHTNPLLFKEHDVIYVIIDGNASIESSNRIIKCRNYDIVFVPNNEQHIIVNTGDIHLRYLIMKEKI